MGHLYGSIGNMFLYWLYDVDSIPYKSVIVFIYAYIDVYLIWLVLLYLAYVCII